MSAAMRPMTKFLNIGNAPLSNLMPSSPKIVTNQPGLIVPQCPVCMRATKITDPVVMQLHPCSNPQCKIKYNIVNWRWVTDPKELERWFEDAVSAPSTSFDFETTSLDVFTNRVTGTSFCREDQPGHAIYVPVYHVSGELMEEELFGIIFREFASLHPMNAHNFQFEYKHCIIKYDFEPKVHSDTQIEAYLDDSNRCGRFDGRGLGLKDLAKELYDLDVTEIDELIDLKTQNFSFLAVKAGYEYGCQDSDMSTRLVRQWRNKNLDEQPLIHRLEHSLIEGLSKSNLRGMPLDVRKIADEATVIDKEIDSLQRQVFTLMGFDVPTDPDDPMYEMWVPPFDLGSKQKVAEQFFLKMNLPFDESYVGKPNKVFPKGQPSVSKDALENLRHEYEVYDVYLKYGEATHMRDNFISKLPDYINPVTGVTHPNVNQTGAPTGRCSHSNYNAAQIPAKRD